MRRRMILATVVAAAVLSGCGTVNWMTIGVANPVTPQQLFGGIQGEHHGVVIRR